MDYNWSRIQKLDEKITITEPFKLVKTEPEKAKQIIDDLRIELILIARTLQAFMPNTSTCQAAMRFNDGTGDYVVTVSDMLGQTVLRESSSQRNFNLNMTENAPGIYLVQILNSNGDKKVMRMVISE